MKVTVGGDKAIIEKEQIIILGKHDSITISRETLYRVVETMKAM